MRKRAIRRAVSAAILVGAGGFVVSGPGTSCTSFFVESSLESANFCFIFDCQNGILGGTFDPCSGVGSGDQTVEGVTTGEQFFTDCPTTGG